MVTIGPLLFYGCGRKLAGLNCPPGVAGFFGGQTSFVWEAWSLWLSGQVIFKSDRGETEF